MRSRLSKCIQDAGRMLLGSLQHLNQLTAIRLQSHVKTRRNEVVQAFKVDIRFVFGLSHHS